MAQDDSQSRDGPKVRVAGIPGGWFGKLLALLLAAAIGVLALSFSLAILVVVFVVGLTIWGYFLIRRAVLGAPPARTRSPHGDRTRRGPPDDGPDGRVIDGEVLGRDDADRADADRRPAPGPRD